MIIIFNLFKYILNSFLIVFILRRYLLIIVLKSLNYLYFFFFIKTSNLLKFETLSDLTVIHYPDHIFEFQLIYINLSYKLNLRIWSNLNIKKDDLVISLSSIYINAN
jgi:NADH:ubiquinone oxidoreductase subunit C